ncbi:mannosyl-oligosaccharide glucosidase NDAI_0D03690 [Naumovozyma dairenensis CBS 421]|uniref:Mannosyl-oligosaccharide glucosidase n=1 Tax=Naumovozyma dairenensis (strain ATCC 10597 / BCRC 20456 / CBS 421 / NBRC 0211 / NRRL Y-12639) TaxID=1071378 RepID=G0WA72_NAUDC|nr:hypothetical protein NDAI_0D03690 [Naumovozyma dairenensis CBS 421]CCD24683.1 hypothetical protein NDAI_0D03690 [Naumovozyma dairenensis CBS 421]
MVGINILTFCWLLFQSVAGSDDFENDVYEKSINQTLLWGPYRSNCYFGITPRYIDESPFVMGLMWFDSHLTNGISSMRHFVDENDRMKKYGWNAFDPRIGGEEVIIDEENNVNLSLSFVKSHDGLNWALRVKGKPLDLNKKSTTSIVLYMQQQGDANTNELLKTRDEEHFVLKGKSTQLGKYDISIKDNEGRYYKDPTLKSMKIAEGADCSQMSHLSLNVPDHESWKARDIFQTIIGDSIKDIVQEQGSMDNFDNRLTPSLYQIRNIYNLPPGNFHYVQKTFDLSDTEGFEFDMIFNSAQSKQRIESYNEISSLITSALNEINIKFDKIFTIDSEEKRNFALETLSNLLGGIGYFHGTQIIDRTTVFDEDQFQEIKLINGKEEGPYSLFTSVPSRSKFPRGFYWDEGFHLLQIMEYDLDLAFEIMASWVDLIDEDGWVAREVILGDEARSRVPAEFTVQSPKIANPPTLLLAFSEMLQRVTGNVDNFHCDESTEDDTIGDFTQDGNRLENNPDLIKEYARKVYPKLLKHYNWFRRTQKGVIDEYSDIFEEEGIWDSIHKDEVFKWVGRTATHCLPSGLDDYPRAPTPDIAELHVDALSWVGIMTRSMKQIANILNQENDEKLYAQIESNIIENLETLHWNPKSGSYCDITIDEEYGDSREFICHDGYISLLPFALKLIPKDSPNLDKVVSLIADEDKLFSPFGILSLSKQDEYFGRGENYWRGPIWMNINYLVLDALKYYYPEITSTQKSKRTPAAKLCNELSNRLIKNVYRVWKHSGYCYENYSPIDGHGMGTEHFTGWTALIVNILGRS